MMLKKQSISLIGFLVLCFCLLIPGDAWGAIATGNILQQIPREVTITLGNSANELKFEPSDIEFQAGQRYKLHLTNPSQQKHYFTAKDFADIIWTQKVDAGRVEIKGAIHELELRPGTEADWVFVPLKPGKYNLRCPIAGHTEAGMVGEIVVN
jgi:uncharacterized cupredoxin-like copper-binding protein